jgi:hypothetical protein
MATDNPKVSAYVPPVVKDRLTQFREEKGISESQAVIVILSEYFGLKQELNRLSKGIEVGGITLSRMELAEDGLSDVRQKLSDFVNAVEKRFQELEKAIANLSKPLVVQSNLPVEIASEPINGLESGLPDSNGVVAKEESIVTPGGSPKSGLLSEQQDTESVAPDIEQKSSSSGSLQSELQLNVPETERFQPLSGKVIASRLGYKNPQSLSNKKSSVSDAEFIDWSREKDPDGIGWHHHGKGRAKGSGYLPADDLSSEQLEKLVDWIKENSG